MTNPVASRSGGLSAKLDAGSRARLDLWHATGRHGAAQVARPAATRHPPNVRLKTKPGEVAAPGDQAVSGQLKLVPASGNSHLAAGLVHTTAHGIFLRVNDRFCEITGYGRDELIGHRILEITHPEDVAVEEEIQRRAAAGEFLTHVWEKRCVRKDGSIVFMKNTASILRGDSNEPELFITIVEDITAQRITAPKPKKRTGERPHVTPEEGRQNNASPLKSEFAAQGKKLRQAQADLAYMSRVSTMAKLAASLAHEIKQPIAAAVTNARTCARWLQRDQPDIAEACEAVSRMVNDVKRAADIIDRVRSLYRRETPQRELVDANEIIRGMTALLRHQANRQSIAIRTDLAEDLPEVMADRVQVQQVLMNLMLNGMEAMKDTAGELVIKSLATEHRQLLISVRDSGVGIPAEQADRIFEAFFTTKPHGTGMGLAISRTIIESHGGRLWATRNSGRGATFCFTLPVPVKG